jgi:uncharacterized membrane protein YheB (UPF0754 family)
LIHSDHNPYLSLRALVCQPNTKQVDGLFDKDLLNESIFNTWPITHASSDIIQAVKNSIQNSIAKIRMKIMQETAKILRTGSSQAFTEDVPEDIQTHFINQYSALNVNSIIAQIALNFAGHPKSHPLNGKDLLKEIDQYKGTRIHPLHLLQTYNQNLKTEIIPQPASDKKQAREQFLHEVTADIVPDLIAESECKGIIECENLVQSKTFQTLFQQLPRHIQERYPYKALEAPK